MVRTPALLPTTCKQFLSFIKSSRMSINDYKASIKSLIDSTDNETLLKQWKEQLEWDVEYQGEAEFSDEEWQAVQEGLADYSNGKVISLKEFMEKR